jgi:hypothetical protein
MVLDHEDPVESLHCMQCLLASLCLPLPSTPGVKKTDMPPTTRTSYSKEGKYSFSDFSCTAKGFATCSHSSLGTIPVLPSLDLRLYCGKC